MHRTMMMIKSQKAGDTASGVTIISALNATAHRMPRDSVSMCNVRRGTVKRVVHLNYIIISVANAAKSCVMTVNTDSRRSHIAQAALLTEFLTRSGTRMLWNSTYNCLFGFYAYGSYSMQKQTLNQYG